MSISSVSRPIFPQFEGLLGIENQVLDFLGCALIPLSQTCWNAQNKLTNIFFQKCFLRENPHLMEWEHHVCNPAVGSVIGKKLPDFCWKVLCGASLKGYLRISLPFFMDVAAVSIHKAAQSEKDLCESRRASIYESHCKDSNNCEDPNNCKDLNDFKDPNNSKNPKSLIQQAATDYLLKEKPLEQKIKNIEEALKALKSFHPEKEYDFVFSEIMFRPNHYFPGGQPSEWLEKSEDIKPFDRSLLPEYFTLSQERVLVLSYSVETFPVPPEDVPVWGPLLQEAIEKEGENGQKIRKEFLEFKHSLNNLACLEKQGSNVQRVLICLNRELSILEPFLPPSLELERLKGTPTYYHEEALMKYLDKKISEPENPSFLEDESWVSSEEDSDSSSVDFGQEGKPAQIVACPSQPAQIIIRDFWEIDEERALEIADQLPPEGKYLVLFAIYRSLFAKEFKFLKPRQS